MKWTKADAIALGVFGAVSVFLAVMVFRVPEITGWWTDDAIYISNAKSLAEGHGYRHSHLPGQPWQTKYPPLYSMVLAPFWSGANPISNVVFAGRVINAVSWVLAGGLVYLIARRQLRLSAVAAGIAALIGIAEVQSLDVLNTTMSEALYAFLSIAAVACAGVVSRSGGPPARRWWAWALASGVLATLAVLTRSIGVTCVFACTAGILLSGRWRPAAVCGVVGVAGVGGFMAWRAALAARNAAIPQSAALAYDLDYSAWITKDIGSVLHVAWINSGDLLLCVTQRVLPWPGDWLLWSISEGWITEVLYLAWCALIWGCIGVGLVHVWRRASAVIPLYVLAYLGMTVVWPFPPVRFVMPLSPLISLVFVVGLISAVTWIGTRLWRLILTGEQSKVEREAASLGSALGQRAVWIAAIITLGQTALIWADAFSRPPQAAMTRGRDAAAKLITEKTPTDAVVAAWSPAYMSLVSGRECVPIAPADNPVAQRYPSTRSWRMLGTDANMTNEEFFRTMYRERLETNYARAGVTHAVVPPDSVPAKLMLEHFSSHRDRFRQVVGEKGFWLYEYTPGLIAR